MVNAIVLACIYLQVVHIQWIAAEPVHAIPSKSVPVSEFSPTDHANGKLNGTKLPGNSTVPVTNAKDFLQDLHDKIVGMEKRITNTENAERILDGIVSQNSNIFYYPKGTKDHVAKKYYEEYDYTFIGWGNYGTHSGSNFAVSGANTVGECLTACFGKRIHDKAYNGISFYHIGNVGNRCVCVPNEKGHYESNSYLHYKYVLVN